MIQYLRKTNRFPDKQLQRQFQPHQRGFTLVELLVVIAIILTLTAVTIASFNYSTNADRVRAGARQIQSFLGGARDKAIYAKEVRGVRLLLDPNNNHAVTAVQYVGSPERDSGLLSFDSTGRVVSRVGFTGIDWPSLARRGFLRSGSRIQIPRDIGAWYVVSGFNSATGEITLNRPNRELAGSSTQVGYVLELAPAVLGDAQPIPFPRGVAIDLDGSNVPSSWRPISFNGSYSPTMDILFTPRGTVIGDAASLGMIHLHFADVGDIVKWSNLVGRDSTYYNSPLGRLPLVPADDPSSTTLIVTKDRILATLATRTGNVSVHHVDPTNTASYTGPLDFLKFADDPFRFAETGQVANK